jgi:DNA-binding NtrC family response regulator
MNKPVILIIDDEENVLSALNRLLRKEPYSVVTTTSPKKALKFLERMVVSLVITDQKMEEVSGEEVVQQVAQKYPGTMFIILTGYPHTIDVAQMKGEVKVVTKPWNDDELKQTILSMLNMDNYQFVSITATNQEEYKCSSTESL